MANPGSPKANNTDPSNSGTIKDNRSISLLVSDDLGEST